MMDKAEIERQNLLLQPVREKITVEHIDEFPTQTGRTLFIIHGHVEGEWLSSRKMRTIHGWMATICQQSRGGSIWMTWRRNPTNVKSWNELDLIGVEPK